MVYGDKLEHLRRLAEQDNDRPARRREAIEAALAAGHSRKEIAAALGITRQALHQYLGRRTK